MNQSDPLAPLAQDYFSSGDLRGFMERASPWIMEYAARRLNRDPDIIGDFYVHFYERAERCLEVYKERQNLPFTGFLVTYLRHEYMNFIRRRRRREVREVSQPDIVAAAPAAPTGPGLEGMALSAVRALEPDLRVPLKLSFGMELEIADLRYLVAKMPDPRCAADFVVRYEQRCAERLERMGQVRDRAARLTHMIEQAQGMPVRTGRWRRWKDRVLRVLSRDGRVLTRSDIASALDVNKSTITRRIDKAIRSLNGENTWQLSAQTTIQTSRT